MTKPCLPGRAPPPRGERAISHAVPRAACGRRLSQRPERLAGQLRRTASSRPAGRHVDHRRRRQLPGQPAHGQVAADAMVSARGRLAAAGPIRRLQRHARVRVWPALRTDVPPAPDIGEGGIIPPVSGQSHRPAGAVLPRPVAPKTHPRHRTALNSPGLMPSFGQRACAVDMAPLFPSSAVQAGRYPGTRHAADPAYKVVRCGAAFQRFRTTAG
jgi:hypothetical protein